MARSTAWLCATCSNILAVVPDYTLSTDSACCCVGRRPLGLRHMIHKHSKCMVHAGWFSSRLSWCIEVEAWKVCIMTGISSGHIATPCSTVLALHSAIQCTTCISLLCLFFSHLTSTCLTRGAGALHPSCSSASPSLCGCSAHTLMCVESSPHCSCPGDVVSSLQDIAMRWRCFASVNAP